MQKKIKIAIFASGKGGNAKALIDATQNQLTNYTIGLIVSNNPNAGVLQIAAQNNIPAQLITKEIFSDCLGLIALLQKNNINIIVLAGFLWKIPVAFIQSFKDKIINIHPALLPQYGGKGMYGHFVHEAVLKNNEKESGITIHLVDEIYDNGKILFQAKCAIASDETPETLAAKIQSLEHQYYPQEMHKFVARMQQEKFDFITSVFPSSVATLQPMQIGSWGKMNAQQMVEHVSEIFKVSAGLVHYPLETPAEYLPKYKAFLWTEKPFKENTKAPVSFVAEEPTPVKEPTFEKALETLHTAIQAFVAFFKNNATATTLHPSFGDLNFDEWVQIHHKHLLHHAKQFGLC